MAQIPTLSYVGSVDTTNSSSGVNMFRILFDQSITGILMFEYQVLVSTTELTPPSQITTGFINPDSAQTDGIQNQWLIPIPATGNDYVTGQVVRVRVYPSQGLNVTDWSNALDFYNPPAAPVILIGKYDADTTPYYYNDDDLWVLLQGAAQPGISYLMAYYFCDSSNETVWQVSSLLEPSEVIFDGSACLVVHTNMGDDVSTDPSKNLVYVAVHAVYAFQDASDQTFYTISEISNTVAANQASYEPPVLLPVDYDYTIQNITLTWEAPTSSFLPFYAVSTYDIYLNDVLLDTVNGDVTTYSYTNTIETCGTTLSYYVVANSETGAPSQTSNTESVDVFYASQGVTFLSYDWAIRNQETNSARVAFTFKNPIDNNIGCGSSPIVNWQIVNVDASNLVVEDGSLTYDPSATLYVVATNFPYVAGTQYKIAVFISTINPNDGDRVDGVVEYSSVIVPVDIPIIYNIELITNTDYPLLSGVRFNVASEVPLNPIGQIVNATAGPLNINNRPFNTEDFDYVILDGILIYSCTLLWVNLPLSPIPTHFTIAVSNPAGVGVGTYITPLPPLP